MPKSNGAPVSFSPDKDHHEVDSGQESTKVRKKRKTAHACRPCQEAHLVCDENRPCLRCSKKGMVESCVDGVRKKAKYMEDSLFQKDDRKPYHP
ncbi:Transcriptional regulator of nonfermentable carbon utilization [Dinochytrium kinnereticum]|nr:Transcriptional regulator of nonfermentable carbon utilization [Dinochytrium kinnereticum]